MKFAQKHLLKPQGEKAIEAAAAERIKEAAAMVARAAQACSYEAESIFSES